MWVYGPAGVGKSAVAQSCAELFADRKQLLSAYFFSRSDVRNKAKYLFTSIAYQISTRNKVYREILDRRIRDDPALLTQALHEQFQELVIKPLEEARAHGTHTIGAEPFVVIIDGLDECDSSDGQHRILEVVARSAQKHSLPFRWIIFSRAEPHITASFKRHDLHGLTCQTEVPVSRNIDHDIFCFLIDKLEEIGRGASLPSSWFSEDDVQVLVNLCAGLFIYAVTIERFVSKNNSFGPVSQLQAVLHLASTARTDRNTDNPLSELDLFYTLIMGQVPPEVLPTIRKILLLHSPDLHFPFTASAIANVLGLDKYQFQHACSLLHSVLELKYPYEEPDDETLVIRFHHRSFMDFMHDPKRSTKFSTYLDDLLNATRSELLDSLNHTMCGARTTNTMLEVPWPNSLMTGDWLCWYRLETLLDLCQMFCPVEESLALKLSAFRFDRLLHVSKHYQDIGSRTLDPEKLRQQLPENFRDQVVRPANALQEFLVLTSWHKPPPSCCSSSTPYVLGRGQNRVLCWKASDSCSSFKWRFQPCPNSIFALFME